MIYPNWLMCIGESTIYVDGLDYSLQENNLECEIDDDNLSFTVNSNDLTMEIK